MLLPLCVYLALPLCVLIRLLPLPAPLDTVPPMQAVVNSAQQPAASTHSQPTLASDWVGTVSTSGSTDTASIGIDRGTGATGAISGGIAISGISTVTLTPTATDSMQYAGTLYSKASTTGTRDVECADDMGVDDTGMEGMGVEGMSDIEDMEFATPLMTPCRPAHDHPLPSSLQSLSLLQGAVSVSLVVMSLIVLCYWSVRLIGTTQDAPAALQSKYLLKASRMDTEDTVMSDCFSHGNVASSLYPATNFYHHILVSPSPHLTRHGSAGRHFVSFGAGAFSAWRIGQEALSLGLFDTITIFNDTSEEWKEAFPLHTTSPGRGYGFWYWKSRVIQLVIQRVAQPDDLVFYVDGGCQLSRSYEWMEWFSLVKQHDLIAFRLTHLEQVLHEIRRLSSLRPCAQRFTRRSHTANTRNLHTVAQHSSLTQPTVLVAQCHRRLPSYIRGEQHIR